MRDGDLDVVGLGRPLCGSPSCVNALLAADSDAIFALPSYEEQLMPFYDNWFGSILRYGVSLLASLLGMNSKAFYPACVQSWYYVNIYHIADGEVEKCGDLNEGCVAAFLHNDKVEGAIATSLVGPDCTVSS